MPDLRLRSLASPVAPVAHTGLKSASASPVYPPMPALASTTSDVANVAKGYDLRALESEVYRHDARGDHAAAAQARVALGRALLENDDPLGREILEDVGAWYEELGDEAAVLAIDGALREAAQLIEESPRSFQASSRRKTIPPMRT